VVFFEHRHLLLHYLLVLRQEAIMLGGAIISMAQLDSYPYTTICLPIAVDKQMLRRTGYRLGNRPRLDCLPIAVGKQMLRRTGYRLGDRPRLDLVID